MQKLKPSIVLWRDPAMQQEDNESPGYLTVSIGFLLPSDGNWTRIAMSTGSLDNEPSDILEIHRSWIVKLRMISMTNADMTRKRTKV
jgi:hypothetical protein